MAEKKKIEKMVTVPDYGTEQEAPGPGPMEETAEMPVAVMTSGAQGASSTSVLAFDELVVLASRACVPMSGTTMHDVRQGVVTAMAKLGPASEQELVSLTRRFQDAAVSLAGAVHEHSFIRSTDRG